jgi:antitoxin StbD
LFTLLNRYIISHLAASRIEHLESLRPILADMTIIISEFKKTPMAVVKQADGFPLAVMNRNKPEFYFFSADACADLLHKLVDIELAQIVKAAH